MRQYCAPERTADPFLYSSVFSPKKDNTLQTSDFANKKEQWPFRAEIQYLHVRLGLLEAELNFRLHNFDGQNSKRDPESPGPALPRQFSSRCHQQLTSIRKFRERSSTTANTRRIALPDHPQQLWAQHKYSIMARDPNAYQEYGHYFAQMKQSPEGFHSAGELTSYLFVPPPAGRLRNALHHMWGYVSKESSSAADSNLPSLLSHIQQLAAEQGQQYLLQSTALTELAYWTTSDL